VNYKLKSDNNQLKTIVIIGAENVMPYKTLKNALKKML